MQEQIQRDLSKTDLMSDASDYGNTLLTDGTIAFYIKEAIRYYSKNRLGFNEEAATLTADGTDSISLPSDFIRDIDLVDTTHSRSLTKKPLGYIINLSPSYSSTVTEPCYYTIFEGAVTFPDQVTLNTQFTLYYIKELPELVNDTDSNAWTMEANAAIRARAMGDIFMFKRRSASDAQAMYAMAEQNIQNIIGQYAREQSTGRLTPNMI